MNPPYRVRHVRRKLLFKGFRSTVEGTFYSQDNAMVAALVVSLRRFGKVVVERWATDHYAPLGYYDDRGTWHEMETER